MRWCGHAVLAEPVLEVWQVKVRPHETLFRVGDSSEAGIFIVVEGRLGVFLQVGVAASRFVCLFLFCDRMS